MTFYRLRADATFEAESIDDAAEKLATYFATIASSETPPPGELNFDAPSEVSIEPVRENEPSSTPAFGCPRCGERLAGRTSNQALDHIFRCVFRDLADIRRALRIAPL